MSQKIRFIDTGKSEFFATVRKRVDVYFKEKNLSKNANAAMWAKSAFFLSGLVILYSLIISNHFSPIVMLGLAILLGMFAAFIGFNVCHDAIHGSYSANPTIN